MHESKPEIEKYANQSKWLESTLMDMEKQMDTSFILHTPALQERNEKRTREEGFFSNKDITDDKFEIMCREKPKPNPVNEQEETVDTIETIDCNKGQKPDLIMIWSKKLRFFDISEQWEC